MNRKFDVVFILVNTKKGFFLFFTRQNKVIVMFQSKCLPSSRAPLFSPPVLVDWKVPLTTQEIDELTESRVQDVREMVRFLTERKSDFEGQNLTDFKTFMAFCAEAFVEKKIVVPFYFYYCGMTSKVFRTEFLSGDRPDQLKPLIEQKLKNILKQRPDKKIPLSLAIGFTKYFEDLAQHSRTILDLYTNVQQKFLKIVSECNFSFLDVVRDKNVQGWIRDQKSHQNHFLFHAKIFQDLVGSGESLELFYPFTKPPASPQLELTLCKAFFEGAHEDTIRFPNQLYMFYKSLQLQPVDQIPLPIGIASLSPRAPDDMLASESQLDPDLALGYTPTELWPLLQQLLENPDSPFGYVPYALPGEPSNINFFNNRFRFIRCVAPNQSLFLNHTTSLNPVLFAPSRNFLFSPHHSPTLTLKLQRKWVKQTVSDAIREHLHWKFWNCPSLNSAFYAFQHPQPFLYQLAQPPPPRRALSHPLPPVRRKPVSSSSSSSSSPSSTAVSSTSNASSSSAAVSSTSTASSSPTTASAASSSASAAVSSMSTASSSSPFSTAVSPS